MQFESRYKRENFIRYIIVLIAELFISFIAVRILYGEFNILYSLIAFIVLEISLFVIWVTRSIFLIGSYFIFWKKITTESILNNLIENKMPPPRNYEISPEDYLDYVIKNEELDSDIRIKAAIDLGILSEISRQGRIGFMQAFEYALEDYKRYCNSCNKKEKNQE